MHKFSCTVVAVLCYWNESTHCRIF